jgi:hypothetical protein
LTVVFELWQYRIFAAWAAMIFLEGIQMIRSWIRTVERLDTAGRLHLRPCPGVFVCAFGQRDQMNYQPKPNGDGRTEQLV